MIFICALAWSASSLPPSPDFTVNFDGSEAFVYLATADSSGGLFNASFVLLSLKEEPLHVEVRPSKPFYEAALRPRLGAPHVSSDSGTISFTVDQPGQFILELDGHYEASTLGKGLMLFVDRPTAAPPPSPNTVFFGPGVHRIAGGSLSLQNDTTYYLDEDAILVGRLHGINLRNVTVTGRGMLAPLAIPGGVLPPASLACHHCRCPGHPAIFLQSAQDIILEGITVLHADWWIVKLQGLQRARVSNLRILGWRCNNDGIDLISSYDVIIENNFIRSSDDAISLKAFDGDVPSPERDTHLGVSNVLVEGNVLWNMNGNCLEIGYELFTESMTNISFQRNQCLHQHGSAMSIHNAGHADVSNITYMSNTIEMVVPVNASFLDPSHSGWLTLLDLLVVGDAYSGPDYKRRGSIRNIGFDNNIVHPNSMRTLVVKADGTVTGLPVLASRLAGNASAHAVRDVVFSRLVIGGKRALTLKDINATVNEWVGGISFQ